MLLVPPEFLAHRRQCKLLGQDWADMSLNSSLFRLICHDALQNLLATSKSQSKSLFVFEPCIAWDVMQTDCILLISVLNACMNHNLVPPIQRSISRICQGFAELGWISWSHCSVLPLEKSMVHQELQGDDVSVGQGCCGGTAQPGAGLLARSCLWQLGRQDVALGGVSRALSVQRILQLPLLQGAACAPHWNGRQAVGG